MAYQIDRLPLETLIGPAARATEVLTRLDERLARSPVRAGWIERSHFHDAVAALWIEGELVDLEDLVFRDATMDRRAPTHELTRAHAVLRKRRRIVSQSREWALGHDGLRELAGVRAAAGTMSNGDGEGEGARAEAAEEVLPTETPDDDALAQEFTEIDAVLARSSRILAGDYASTVPTPPEARREDPLGLIYDLDWDEGARLAEWLRLIERTGHLPLVLRAAILLDGWNDIEVLQREPWIGSLLVAALFRQEGLCAHHLACLNLGARNIPRERRRARDRADRLLAWIDAMYEAASAGMREHDRLLLAREQMERRARGRRASSKLPVLVDLVLSRPLVSTSMIQEALKVSRQGALNLIGELGLRELTGKASYRAWGIV